MGRALALVPVERSHDLNQVELVVVPEVWVKPVSILINQAAEAEASPACWASMYSEMTAEMIAASM